MRKLLAILFCAVVVMWACGSVYGAGCSGSCTDFIRGDVTEDFEVDSDDVGAFYDYCIADILPIAVDSCDVDDDGNIDADDGVWLATYVYLSGPAPDAPFGSACLDPTYDALDTECTGEPVVGSISSYTIPDINRTEGNPPWKKDWSYYSGSNVICLGSKTESTCCEHLGHTDWHNGTWFIDGSDTDNTKVTTYELSAGHRQLEYVFYVSTYAHAYGVCNDCQDEEDDYNTITIDGTNTPWFLEFWHVGAGTPTTYKVEVPHSYEQGWNGPYQSGNYQHTKNGGYCYVNFTQQAWDNERHVYFDGEDIADALCDLPSGPDEDDELLLYAIHFGESGIGNGVSINWSVNVVYVDLAYKEEAKLILEYTALGWLDDCDD